MTHPLRSLPTPAATPPGRVLYQSGPGRPEREWFVYRSASAGASAPVFVVVHGIAQNPAEYVFRLVESAERRGLIVIAPLFAKDAYGQYQQVVDPRGRGRADLALLDIVAAVSRAVGSEGAPFHLFGVSGGGQFAHRFAMLHPERVASVSLAAPGWYTFPDTEGEWPLGLGSHPTPGGAFDPAFADIPYQLFVGERDTERDGSLRQSPEIDSRQGRNRLERARRWAEAMRARGADVSLNLIPNTGHALGRAFEREGLADQILDAVGLCEPKSAASQQNLETSR